MPILQNRGYESLSHSQYYQEFYNEQMEDVVFTVYGYKKSLYHKFQYHLLSILLLGIPYIVITMYTSFQRIKYKRCPISEADVLFIEDDLQNVTFVPIQYQSIVLPATDNQIDLIYFYFHFTKYVWLTEENRFGTVLELLPAIVLDENFIVADGLTVFEHENLLKLYGPNKIEIEVKSYWKLFKEEVSDPFYCFQAFSMTLWFFDNYYSYSLCVLFLTIISTVMSIYQTRKNSETLHDMVVKSQAIEVQVIRQILSVPKTITVRPSDLVPGDIIVLPSSDYIMPCDAIVLNGQCVVNECALTGESVPVTKTAVQCNNDLYDLDIHKNITLFAGTLLLQARYYENQPVLAKVLRTGFYTSKGALVKTILFPSPISIKFYQDSCKFVLFLGMVALFGMGYCIHLYLARNEIKKAFIRSLDIITILVPPALPAAMAVGTTYSQIRLKKLGIFCIDRNRINFCGEVRLVCFDKTGTLTHEGLVTSKVIPCKNGQFQPSIRDTDTLSQNCKLVNAMAACHTLAKIEDDVEGDPIDLCLFKFSKWTFSHQGSATSIASHILTPSTSYESMDLDYHIEVLRQFPFCPLHLCMSVLCRVYENDGYKTMAYTKGAPERIQEISIPSSIPKNYMEILSKYTVRGFRVISIAYKELPKQENVMSILDLDREEIECNLIFLGFVIMINPLKPETVPTIQDLHTANLKTVMITGDNLLTGVAVGYSSGIIKPNEHLFVLTVNCVPGYHYSKLYLKKAPDPVNSNESVVPFDIDDYTFAIDGETWEKLKIEFPDMLFKILVRTIIFGRCRPDQKIEIIKAFQSINYVVCMVGDGDNDCGALKAAHVGVSLSEGEASVAAPFTSSIQNISCVIHLLLEGRCALVTSFATFKYMALYSFIQFFSVIILYREYTDLMDYQFFFIDFFITILLTLTISNQGPSHKLSPEMPLRSLISPCNTFPLLLQIGVCALVQLGALFYLFRQPWFTPNSSNKTRFTATWENTIIFTVSCFQYIILATVYSKGKPHRQRLYANKWFIINAMLITTFCLWMMMYPCKWVANLMQLMPVEADNEHQRNFKFSLVIFPAVHFIVSFLIEIYIADTAWLQKVIMFVQKKYRTKSSISLDPNDFGNDWINFEEIMM